MCGIAGFIATRPFEYTEVLENMVSELDHRGPDSHGMWINDNLKIGLAHARLSILDLSMTGHQPMNSGSGRFVMSFNGEIYNHLEIRKEVNTLRRCNWKGTSDTETILAAIDTWGIGATIEKCVGMFAIAIFDLEKLELTLLRDRMGEKPLYYGYVNDNLLFASELNAIKRFPLFSNPINRNAIALYLQHAAIPEPYSIYDNIYKLEAGSSITIDMGTRRTNKNQYWNTQHKANVGARSPITIAADNAVQHLDELLTKAVGSQMNADVPLGAFLSGGVDSSTVVALLQAQSQTKVNTFSIGFEQKEYNEAEYAKKSCDILGHKSS